MKNIICFYNYFSYIYLYKYTENYCKNNDL